MAKIVGLDKQAQTQCAWPNSVKQEMSSGEDEQSAIMVGMHEIWFRKIENQVAANLSKTAV